MKKLFNLGITCLCIMLSPGVGFSQPEKFGIPPNFNAVVGSCVYGDNICVIFLNDAMPKVRYFVILECKNYCREMLPVKAVRLEEKDTGIQETVVWQRNK